MQQNATICNTDKHINTTINNYKGYAIAIVFIFCLQILWNFIMQLTTEQIDSFKVLYKKHFDIELENKEALDLWLVLINHVKIILSSNQKYIWKK